ncbi:YbjP/YqhG family protein [Shinella sp. CPCC 101442]|uniref:YbjP/YqhG family protein n=1 Tax=Shinella sp. CPCC 101442 TaxID=2932265 RepID=UPI002152E4DC|nr:YbjP/YqhG family protein [Shinella sp. CPCC 101442]MCR6501975.1 YbjP/YqhG family protein [Shinella sp. CPCC 101442]
MTTVLTRRTVLLGLASAALAAALPAFPVFAAERPEEIVEKIYAAYANDGNGPQDVPYVRDVAEQLSGENHPGFDFFIDAQDFDKVSAVVALVSESAKDAVVRAEMTNFGATKTVEIDFVKNGPNWKIGNVRYPVAGGFDLRQSLGLSAL